MSQLARHPSPFLTPAELAQLWHVRASDIIAVIHARELPALRFTPRLFRISKTDAIQYEQAAGFPFRSPRGTRFR